MPDRASRPKLLLIDGNNLLYRAFFALPLSMRTKSGQATNAVYGFTTMILKLIEDQKPDLAAVAFDSREPTFRHELYEAYKANREETPDDLISQFAPARDVLAAIGIKKLEEPGQEADDIIAALANEGKKAGYEVSVITSDKDMLQLVADQISVVSSKKSIAEMVVYDREKVFERYGVYPEHIPDLLALKGDSSDNIPGVPGIGEKTAAKLIQQFGPLDSIYEHLEEVKPDRIRGLLQQHEDVARLSKTLTVLHGEGVTERDLGALLIDEPDQKRTSKLFRELEFFTLLKKFAAGAADGGDMRPASKEPVTDRSTAATYSDQGSLFGSDEGPAISPAALPDASPGDQEVNFAGTAEMEHTSHAADLRELTLREYTDLPPHMRDLVVVNVVVEQMGPIDDTAPIIKNVIFLFKGGYLIWLGESEAADRGAGSAEKLAELEKLLIVASTFRRRSGFNIKQTYQYLHRAGLQIDRNALSNERDPDLYAMDHFFTDDPMLAAYCIDPTYSPEELEKLFLRYLHKTKDQVSVGDGDLATARFVETTELLLRLASELDHHLKEQGAEVIYHQIEVPLAAVLAKLELRGIAVDSAVLRKNLVEVTKKLELLEQDIYKHAEGEFNINSPQQLGFILFEKLNLPVQRKTKTGYSTDAQTLDKLKDLHEIVPLILEYRESFKLRSTYFEVLPEIADKHHGRIHTTFNQVQTSTGRLSSSEPNLQNIPVRTDLGRKIREAFVPGDGYDVLINADYSQIELRLLAHFSGDEGLISAFTNGGDIHTLTAAEIMHIDPSQVTEKERRVAKAVNFGIVYGISSFGLSEQLQVPREEAKQYIDLYFSRYPRVVEFIEATIAKVKELGHSETLFGRRRPIPQLRSRVAAEYNLGRRLAVNSVLQGSAADIIKLAMIRAEDHFKDQTEDIQLILSVHDELIFEARREHAIIHQEAVTKIMGDVAELKVPLTVNTQIAENWAALK